VLPGVLLIEVLGQLSGVLLWSNIVEGRESLKSMPGLGVLAGVKQMRFRRLVVPGDCVRLETRLAAGFGSMREFGVSATTDRETVAEGVLQIGFAETAGVDT